MHEKYWPWLGAALCLLTALTLVLTAYILFRPQLPVSFQDAVYVSAARAVGT